MTSERLTIRWSIKWKLLSLMLVLILSLVSVLTALQISSQKKVFQEQLDKRIVLVKKNLVEQGKSLIMNLSREVENDIAGYNFSGALDTIKEMVSKNKEIEYAVLTDADGKVMIQTDGAPNSIQKFGILENRQFKENNFLIR